MQGLQTLAEALQLIKRTSGCWCEAELWRLKGELQQQQFHVQGSKFQEEDNQQAKGKNQKLLPSVPCPLIPKKDQQGAKALSKTLSD
jgi:hypothetical protein